MLCYICCWLHYIYRMITAQRYLKNIKPSKRENLHFGLLNGCKSTKMANVNRNVNTKI